MEPSLEAGSIIAQQDDDADESMDLVEQKVD